MAANNCKNATSTELPSGGYVEIAAPEQLRLSVESCWWYQPEFSGPKEDILIPEGVVDVIFNFGAPWFRQCLGENQGRWIAQDVVVGQRSKLFSIRWSMYTRLFAIRIKAEAAQHLVAMPLKQLTNKTHLITDSAIATLAKGVHRFAFNDMQPIADFCFDYLSDFFSAQHQCDRRLLNAVQKIRACKGDTDVQSLSDEVGLNRRTLERLFSEKIGISPKYFARIERLHCFLCTHSPTSSENLSDSALAAQYYDQSHFIKEFKNFTGETPAAFFEAPPEIYQPLLVSLLGRKR